MTANMKLDEFMYTQAKWPVVMVYQLTSPRTIQAFLVLLFGLVASYLTLQGQVIPDVIAYVLIAIVAFFFGDTRESAALVNLQKGVAARIANGVAEQVVAAELAVVAPVVVASEAGVPPEEVP